MPKKPGAKVNPNSLANLELGRGHGHGRTLEYDQPKKKHGITVTDRGWSGLEFLAKQANLSVSEFLERIGRGMMLINVQQIEALRVQLALGECFERLADPQEIPTPYEQVRQELKLVS